MVSDCTGQTACIKSGKWQKAHEKINAGKEQFIDLEKDRKKNCILPINLKN